MNRLIDDIDQIVENREKSLSLYFWLKDNNLLNTEVVDLYNRFWNNKLIPKEICKHENVVTAVGITTCYDCGMEF